MKDAGTFESPSRSSFAIVHFWLVVDCSAVKSTILTSCSHMSIFVVVQ